jgi:hypothetical protein
VLNVQKVLIQKSFMNQERVNFKTEKELQEAILQEKARGTPTEKLDKKYGVSFRYIEQLITRSQGLNIGVE